ncbi:Ornithine carbamoyltransferase [hydrothermal vent metagenome]|uniref:ornithine carbamoyltransferase n=1 Tax=hydrothermal vent metagenome TaxID=652676 RepID=A0A3B1CZF3_9ZZZZ
MPKRDFLSLAPLSPKDLNWLLLRAEEYKKDFVLLRPLENQVIGLFFEKSSTRTRVSFEVAIKRLGGHPLFLSANDIQVKRGETIADTARVLSSYLDGLVIRTFDQQDLEIWAKNASIPVINGLTDLLHPCQILTDLFTIYQKRGLLKGLKLAYIGDGNNIAHSLLIGGAKTGMQIAVASPKTRQPNKTIFTQAAKLAGESGGSVSIGTDAKEAAKDADILYTDVWVSMGDEDKKASLVKKLKPYQINEALLEQAKSDCLVMHCLPAHRGEEITEAVMEGPNSVIFEQAANRLPVQQAILELLLKK